MIQGKFDVVVQLVNHFRLSLDLLFHRVQLNQLRKHPQPIRIRHRLDIKTQLVHWIHRKFSSQNKIPKNNISFVFLAPNLRVKFLNQQQHRIHLQSNHHPIKKS